MKIFATSDIHGNKALIYLIRRIIEKENIDVTIIAGDIAPKGFYRLFDNGLSCEFYLPFGLKNGEVILEGKSEQIKARLDILGFIEAPHSGYDLSVLESKQLEKLLEVRAQLERLTSRHVLLIRPLLSPEQQKILVGLCAKCGRRWNRE